MSDTQSFDIDGSPLARGNLPVGHLPDNYIEQSIAAIRDCARVVMFQLGVTQNNRDLDHINEYLGSVVAAGEELAVKLPWLENYYRNELRQIVSSVMQTEAVCLNSLNESLLGLVFGPGMRIEAHTDVWAINVNIYLKTADRKPGTSPKFAGGTVIGQKDARSHREILADPLVVLGGKIGTLNIISCTQYPHTIGVNESPTNFEKPDITKDAFWNNPATRISFNISYATKKQLDDEPSLRPMSDVVGYSRPVLGK